MVVVAGVEDAQDVRAGLEGGGEKRKIGGCAGDSEGGAVERAVEHQLHGAGGSGSGRADGGGYGD